MHKTQMLTLFAMMMLLAASATAPAAAGESIPVILSGVSDHHSGLTPGALYKVMGDGVLVEKGRTDHQDESKGRAISPTKLLLSPFFSKR